METFAWVLWWIYTIFYGLLLLILFTIGTVALIAKIRRASLPFGYHFKMTVSMDAILSTITYVFLTIIVFGGYLK